jgi:hypothetical protein
MNDNYYICPLGLDQSEMFETVWTALGNNQAIGIFPEVKFNFPNKFKKIKNIIGYFT